MRYRVTFETQDEKKRWIGMFFGQNTTNQVEPVPGDPLSLDAYEPRNEERMADRAVRKARQECLTSAGSLLTLIGAVHLHIITRDRVSARSALSGILHQAAALDSELNTWDDAWEAAGEGGDDED